MGALSRFCVFFLAFSAFSAAGAVPQDTDCGSNEACSSSRMQDTARDNLLLQSKYRVHAEAPPTAVASSDELHMDRWVFDEDADDEDKASAADLRKWLAEGVARQEEEVEPEEDWTMETTLDNDWIAGGLSDDADFKQLGDEDKTTFVQAAHEKAEEIVAEGGEEAEHEKEAWEHQFSTEHQRAVASLKRHPFLKRTGQRSCERYHGAGGISGLYTFGAPASAVGPLENVRSEDGKFPGLRLVTQRVEFVWRFTRTFHDPVPFIAGLIGLHHPNINLLLLPMNNTPELHDWSKAISSKPRSDMAFWVRGHFQDIYYEMLRPHSDTYDPKAFEMLHLSQAVSPGLNNYTMEGNAALAGRIGWKLVAQSLNVKLHDRDMIIQDNTSLFQDPVTKACALSFVGTHHITQWMVNLRLSRASFCGIHNVHRGFRNQVRRVLQSPSWMANVQPALNACPALYITGHSLGGAQANLVAACLQRAPGKGQAGWEDYKYLAWAPEQDNIKVLPSIV